MKKYVMLVVASLMMVSLTVLAQHPGEGRGPRDERGPGKEMKQERKMEMTPQTQVERLSKHLDLTDAQKADLLKHFEKQAKKREEMKQEFLKLKEKADKDRSAAQEEMEKIIGPENFKKLQAERIEHLQQMNKKLMMAKNKHRRMPAPPCEESCKKAGDKPEAPQN